MANKRLSAVITIGGAVSSTLGAAFGSVRSQTNQVGQAIAQLTARQRELNRAIADQEKLGRAGSALKVQYAQDELRIIGRQIEALKRKQALEQRMAEAQRANLARRQELRGQIGDTAAMAAAVLLPAGAALKSSADFDYQLQVIGNTADMTRPQIAALGVEILKISDETGKSAQTVQKAMGYLVAAGMDVGTAAAVLRPVGRTATATASEIDDVAKATFTLSDALKINPAGMQQALDMLVQSGKEGNFEFKDMAAELPVLAAGFQAMKMTGTEAVATLGAALQIARKGAGSSQQAATNVENFLAKVMSPETLKKASKNFGVDLYKIISDAQSTGQNPFEAAIQAISQMTKGGDQKLLGELFQDMQVQNFLRPMLQNLEEYQRIKAAAMGASGVTDRDFAKMAEQLKQQMDEAANAVGRLAIAVGSALQPAVGGLLSVLTPVVRNVAEFVTENKALVGNLLVVTGGLFAARLAVLAGAFAFTFLKGAVLAVGAAMMANPIGLAVRGIALAATLIYTYWGPIKDWFAQLWASVKATFAGVYDWIVGKVGYLLELPGRVKDKVGSVLGIGAYNNMPSGGTMDGFEPPGAGLPDVPAIASRGGSTTVQDNSQHTYQITQQPGQDAKALAAEIERLQRRGAGVRARSSLVDGVGAQ